MNDYKGLIADLRLGADILDKTGMLLFGGEDMTRIADAIEQLAKERDAAVKCIEDIETYLQWGAPQYAYKVIEEWRGVTE